MNQERHENGKLRLPETYLPEYLGREEVAAETRAEVVALIALALQKGLGRALSASRGKSPFVQDAFHDALVEILKDRYESSPAGRQE